MGCPSVVRSPLTSTALLMAPGNWLSAPMIPETIDVADVVPQPGAVAGGPPVSGAAASIGRAVVAGST